MLELKADEAAVVVGPREALLQTRLTASDVNWIAAEPSGAQRVQAQIRHRHPAAPASVEALEPGRARVTFDTPQTAITPGQAVVFYDGDCVVGGGWIRLRQVCRRAWRRGLKTKTACEGSPRTPFSFLSSRSTFFVAAFYVQTSLRRAHVRAACARFSR